MADAFYLTDLGGLLFIPLCLAVGGLFTSIEAAITTLGTLKVRQLMEEEALTGPELDLWLQHPARVLAITLLISTSSFALASSLLTAIALERLERGALAAAVLAMSLLLIVIGILIPRAIGRAHPRGFGLWGLRLIRALYRPLYPLAVVLGGLSNALLRRMGTSISTQATVTEEELEYLIHLGEKSGVIAASKKEMLSGVFDFDETKVREIMTPRTDVAAIEKSAPFAGALSLIIETGHSRIPVFEGQMDQVVGIVFAKDMLRHAADGAAKVSLAQVMREPLFMPDSKPIMEVFKELKRTKNHMAVIIDEYGGMAGVVTMEDILEEIVGDIQDEFDTEEALVLKLESGVYNVSGAMNISEFCDYFKLDEAFEKVVEGEVDTIGGWMTQLLGDMPEVGQTVTHGPLTIEVSEVGRHRIERLRVAQVLEAAGASAP